jgi:hypothetical protein
VIASCVGIRYSDIEAKCVQHINQFDRVGFVDFQLFYHVSNAISIDYHIFVVAVVDVPADEVKLENNNDRSRSMHSLGCCCSHHRWLSGLPSSKAR